MDALIEGETKGLNLRAGAGSQDEGEGEEVGGLGYLGTTESSESQGPFGKVRVGGGVVGGIRGILVRSGRAPPGTLGADGGWGRRGGEGG